MDTLVEKMDVGHQIWNRENITGDSRKIVTVAEYAGTGANNISTINVTRQIYPADSEEAATLQYKLFVPKLQGVIDRERATEIHLKSMQCVETHEYMFLHQDDQQAYIDLTLTKLLDSRQTLPRGKHALLRIGAHVTLDSKSDLNAFGSNDVVVYAGMPDQSNISFVHYTKPYPGKLQLEQISLPVEPPRSKNTHTVELPHTKAEVAALTYPELAYLTHNPYVGKEKIKKIVSNLF